MYRGVDIERGSYPSLIKRKPGAEFTFKKERKKGRESVKLVGGRQAGR